MAVTKKEENNKKDPGKKVIAKKDTVKKDTGKKELAVKKDKVNRIEQVQKFFRGAYSELKKVHWPTRRETTIYTAVVLVAVVVVGAMIWAFDSALSAVLGLILQR